MDAIQKAIETLENMEFAFKQRGWDAYVDAAEEALTALREYRDENARLREALERVYFDDIFDVTMRDIAREALKGKEE